YCKQRISYPCPSCISDIGGTLGFMKETAERPRLLNFNHLYYFYVTAREGSISAAATKLGVTQPTISEQIKSLERFLGAQLFERHPEGMRLNEAGQIAYEHAEVMFRAS